MAARLADGFRRLCFAIALILSCAPAHIAPAAAQAPGSAGQKPLTIVMLGDSLTAGYGLPQAAALPAVLERLLNAKGRAVRIENAGVSGDTASGGLDRLDWAVGEGIDGVIVALGANDMLRGIDPEVTRKALAEIVARLKERRIPVMLVGMRASPNLGADFVSRFDGLYPALAEAEGLVLYPFLLEGVATDRRLNQPDGIHPTAEGIERIAGMMLPKVEEFLDRLRS